MSQFGTSSVFLWRPVTFDGQNTQNIINQSLQNFNEVNTQSANDGTPRYSAKGSILVGNNTNSLIERLAGSNEHFLIYDNTTADGFRSGNNPSEIYTNTVYSKGASLKLRSDDVFIHDSLDNAKHILNDELGANLTGLQSVAWNGTANQLTYSFNVSNPVQTLTQQLLGVQFLPAGSLNAEAVDQTMVLSSMNNSRALIMSTNTSQADMMINSSAVNVKKNIILDRSGAVSSLGDYMVYGFGPGTITDQPLVGLTSSTTGSGQLNDDAGNNTMVITTNDNTKPIIISTDKTKADIRVTSSTIEMRKNLVIDPDDQIAGPKILFHNVIQMGKTDGVGNIFNNTVDNGMFILSPNNTYIGNTAGQNSTLEIRSTGILLPRTSSIPTSILSNFSEEISTVSIFLESTAGSAAITARYQRINQMVHMFLGGWTRIAGGSGDEIYTGTDIPVEFRPSADSCGLCRVNLSSTRYVAEWIADSTGVLTIRLMNGVTFNNGNAVNMCRAIFSWWIV